MSETKNSNDPFEGLDWDQEIESWDQSAAQPGGASVPESFDSAISSPPPAVSASDAPRVPAAAKQSRPLYRPPSASPAPRPAAGTPAKKTSDRPLPSLLDDEEESHSAATKGGEALRALHEDDDEDEGRTVVAPVSQDLLDQLEAAGIRRGDRSGEGRAADGRTVKSTATGSTAATPVARPSPFAASTPSAPTPPAEAAAPVEIDLLGLDEQGDEHTAEHPAPEPEDPSVVTSAPDFLKQVRTLGKSTTDIRAEVKRPVEAVSAEGRFDPFADLGLEPPVSESLAGDAPRLLAPEQRRHSPDEVTAIFDKNALLADADAAARPSKPDADATLETADPFAVADPFAIADRPAAEDDAPAIAASEEESEGSLFDLVGGEESSDALPATSTPTAEPIVDERPASAFVAGQEDAWRARVERIANDARALDKGPQVRGLVVASEIAAIAGDRARAIELAEEAWQLAPNDALAARQLRQLLAADARWDDVAPLLETEAKSAATPALKAHAALLAADAARLARAAPEEATKLYEAAQRASADDPRPTIARAVSALASSKPLPLLRWPQGSGTEPLAEAVVRRVKSSEPVEDLQLAVILDGIATVAEGGEVDDALAQALSELASTPSLGPGASWLRLGLEAARTKTRRKALERALEMTVPAAIDARLSLALDLGDSAQARVAASDLAARRGDLAATVVRAATSALVGDTTSAETFAPYLQEPGVRAVARGLALAANEEPAATFAADDALDAAARVASRLDRGEAVEADLRARTSSGAQRGFALADALGGGGPRATIEALAPLVSLDPSTADEPLARLLAELAEGSTETAVAAARDAVNAEPTSLPAVSALLALGTEDAEALALAAAEATADESRGATLAMRIALAALGRNDHEVAKRASEIAIGARPGDPVAPFLAELRARRAGDYDGVVDAVRTRAHAAVDPVGRAANLVREIFLLLGSDLGTCIERAQEAAQLAPHDLTMRALYERIAGEGAQGRAEWRAEVAAGLEGHAKAETLLDAAREAERHGDHASAERWSAEAETAGAGAEATALRHRVQARGDGAARLAEELLEAAKRAPDTDAQRELYEALADLDLFARNDTASAIMWHQAILEASPDHLPSLRRLEHMMISVGREDEYEAIASQLARVLPQDSRDAHAEVAARLRLRRPDAAWDCIADLIELATERENPSLWATRLLDALARVRRDDGVALRATDLLLARVDRPAEIAALATRGAEASFRLGDVERARAYLERALDADPQHPTALASLAELRRHAGDWRGAAEAIETMAQTQVVAEHRLEDWHAAAVLWLDKVRDVVRGRAALERAAEIDLGYGDVFERLVSLAREGQEGEVVADLYQRRLGQIEEPEPRAQLQVAYARVLVDLGDRDAARAALASALDSVPTHREALEEGLRLAEEAEDWNEYEQHLIRLSKAQEEPEAQIAVLRRLGALYEGPLPNPSRAEAVYRKILEHREGDDEILARLVDVYVQLGDADMAVETHQERVRVADDPVARRTRLVELGRLLDEVAEDPERALRAYEQARASDPADLDALAALAGFHQKHGRPDAVAAALDSAIDDLRRRIGDDPGDLALFELLAKILELRGRNDAVRVVRAALAGLRGEPGDLVGAEDAAAMPEIDPLVCPPELLLELRAFLDKAGEALEKSVPVDLRALKAAKLGANQPALKAKIDAVARGFGLPDPDVVISRAMPLLCLPVGAKPFQIVIGEGLVSTDDDTARRFALARTMKLCGGRCAALIRVPPPDLKVYLDALLHHLAPNYPPPADVDPERLDEITKRLQRFLPRKEEAELRRLATELDARGAIDVEAIASAAATWGDRVALLAVGDVGAALRGVAWTLGQKDMPQKDPEALRAWLRENPAARDLVAFAISDAYIEARQRCGVADA